MPPEDSGPEGWQIRPVYRQEKQGSEQLSDLPRVIQLASGRSRTRQPLAIPGGTRYKVSVQGSPSRALESRWDPREGSPGRAGLKPQRPGSPQLLSTACGVLSRRTQKVRRGLGPPRRHVGLIVSRSRLQRTARSSPHSRMRVWGLQSLQRSLT